MAVLDLQVFLQERAVEFDENLDVSPGSPFDNKVIQPTLRRLGTDPFTVDLSTFLHDRTKQAFPEIASDEGDAVTDLLIKPATLLWDPIVREVFRIRNSLSFADPETLTREEAAALGANLYAEIESGDVSRGTVRNYFEQPRTVSFTPNNFYTSRTGLHFFPDGIQSITTEEMLLNYDGTLYYFDVEAVAENPGSQYDIGPNEIVSVANIDSAVRVTNLRRFRSGLDEETAVEFVDRAGQELTERSMVTLRGIGAKLTRSFPEISRLNVVGFGDAEMQRDVVRGGGLGSLRAFGSQARVYMDGESGVTSKRLQILDVGVDLTSIIGAVGAEQTSWILTLHDGFAAPPSVRDLEVLKVVDTDKLDLRSSVLDTFKIGNDLPWTLRKKELTLSGIPGGILFPDTDEGTITIPDDEVHVGGMNDIHVRGVQLDETSLVVDNVTDDSPGASGTQLRHTGTGEVTLVDYVMGVNYAENDDTWELFEQAKTYGFTLQILSGAQAGNYRVIGVTQSSLNSPVFELDATLSATAGDYRWRLVDTIEVDLSDPKETRVSGSDMSATQYVDIVTTSGSTDFSALGVSVGDTVRILNTLNAGDYEVKALPGFNQLQLDQGMVETAFGISYIVFRANAAGGVELPLIRIKSIELLDVTGQPVGSVIPYAKPVDIQSRAFQNPGRGVKVDVRDGRLGIVSRSAPSGFNLSGKRFTIYTGLNPIAVLFSGVDPLTPQQVVDQINAVALGWFGVAVELAVVLEDDRVGIVPVSGYTYVLDNLAPKANTDFFGDDQLRTSADIRSDIVDTNLGGWSEVSPAINEDNLDVAQALDGNQIGFYGNLHLGDSAFIAISDYTGLFSGTAFGEYTINHVGETFSPEIGVHIQVGARSIGSVRTYYLEPTSIEFDQDSFFSVTLGSGATVRFFPDPTFQAQRIPAPPSTVMPKDGESADSTNTFSSVSQDFVLSGILPGDKLVVKYVPRAGTVVLADPVVGLALRQLVLSVDDGANQTIIFVNDYEADSTAVTRDGVAEQINAAVGANICSINGANRLEFEADVHITVRYKAAGVPYANDLLGFSTSAPDQDNDSDHAGTYDITDVAPTVLTLDHYWTGSISSQSFQVLRPGAQRISSTEMNDNEAEAGLYYFDVELVSEGTGDLWNIDASLQLTVEEYRSDGYWLTSADENLSFSSVEQPILHLSRTILEVGTSDDLRNATQVSGQNIEITYERSALVVDAQNFATSETERVVCNNPLARHLVPHFVRYEMTYAGGKRTEDVLRAQENYIRGLYPADLLESSDLQEIAYQNGAVSVQNPLDLIAIVHNTDRTVWAQRSQNALSTGRLSAFIPDVIELNRSAS